MRLPRLTQGINSTPKKLAAAIAFATGSSFAFSQALVLEEIVVTATKKDEMVQDIPSTVNVLTGDRLSQLNIFDFKDVEAMTPGLSLTNMDARNSAISMRGISFNPDSRAKDAVVPYLNGVPLRANEAFQQMYDIGRIEILRGPQGTLQGETSPAGSIQMYSKKANLDIVEGEVIQTFSDNAGSNTQVAASMPLIEGVLGVRVAGLYDDSETGITTDSSVGGRTGTRDTRAGRFSVSWLPTDELSADLMYQYMDNHTDGHLAVVGAPLPSATSIKPTLHHSDRKALNEGSRQITNRADLAILELNYEFADHLLTFVSGYQETVNNADEDKDSGNLVAAGGLIPQNPLLPVGPGNPLITNDGISKQIVLTSIEKSSQELRITNTDAELWEYTAGVFYGKSASDTLNRNTAIIGAPLFVDVDAQILSENWGAFLDNKWYVTEDTTIGLGVRWSKNRSNNQAVIDYTDLFPSVAPLVPDSDVVKTGIAWTGGLKVSHQLNEEVMVYASYDRSYRPPGYSIAVGFINPSDLAFDEETSNSFELGFKSTLDNGRFQINGSVFQQDFTDYISRATIVSLYDPQAGGPVGVHNAILSGGTTFGGDAAITGAEFDFNGVITENWTAYFAASYIDAKYDKAERPTAAVGQLAPFDPVLGSSFIKSSGSGRIGPEPNWSISASSEYTVPMGEIDGFVRGLYKFTDNRADDGAGTNIGGYGLFDLFVGVRDTDGAWEASLWAKNLFNKDAFTAIGEPEVGTGYTEVSVTQERIIGITGKYKFGAF